MAKGSRKYLSNVVGQEDMRAVQTTVLQDLSDILIRSFGPKGSNTCIKEMNALNVYTKDGFTILKHLNFNGVIEQSIKDDIESITKNVATTVGDGTTSAVLLANFIFKGLLDYQKKQAEKEESSDDAIIGANFTTPSEILTILNECCAKIDAKIVEHAETATLESLYDVAYTSANGNAWIANIIIDIYKQLGMGAFIDVSPSLNEETSVKYFDGMTLNSGFGDNTCFVNDTRNNSAVIDHPLIFFFEDPIDTKEMGVLFDAIVSRYISTPIQSGEADKVRPVVIVCPHISRDMSSNIDKVLDWQSRQAPGNKIPFLLLSDVTQGSLMRDVMKMCGARGIRKYIDSELYKKDVENNDAPTPFTVHEWAGHADQVSANTSRTKFVNPAKMRNEDGSFSNEYLNLLDYVKTEINKLKSDGEVNGIGHLKRRLHSLQSNLVEINVGGITVADRDSNRHLFEDAVLNCRSAAEHGVGWGANFSGLIASDELMMMNPDADDKRQCVTHDIMGIIYDAYCKLVHILYESCMNKTNADGLFTISMSNKQPFNLRTWEFDGKVRSSIESDCIILSSVAKIIGIMVTCNQFIVPTPQHNVYSDMKEVIINE